MRTIFSAAVTCSVLAVPAAVSAQAALPPVAVPPVNIVLPNYNGVAVGEIAGLEGGAYVARANDASSVLFNPAGLPRAERTSVSGGAGVFDFTRVSPEGLDKDTGSFQQIPALVSFVMKDPMGMKGWSGGFALSRVNAWYQSGNSVRQVSSGASTERVEYSSSSEYSGWLINAGVGHALSDRLSVGGSLDIQLTTTNRRQSIADQFWNDNGLSSLLVGAQGWTWSTHLRGTFGLQYSATPGVRVGALVRTPGLLILKHGSYSQEGTSAAGAAKTTASFYEPSGAVDHRIPTELKGGLGVIGARGQIEADVLLFIGTGTYNAFQSGNTLQIVTDQGQGGPPTVQQVPFTPQVVDSTTVVNIAVGGQLNLAGGGRWRLHGGFTTNRSPVGPADTLFDKIDLQAWTVGLSARTAHLLGSIGLRYEYGSSAALALGPLQIGQQLTTQFDVSNVGIVYSVALLF